MGVVEGLEGRSKGLWLDWTGGKDLGRKAVLYKQNCDVLPNHK